MRKNLPSNVPCVFYVYSDKKNHREIEDAKMMAEAIGFKSIELDYQFYTFNAKIRNQWRIAQMVHQIIKIADDLSTLNLYFFSNDIQGIYSVIGPDGLEGLMKRVIIKDFNYLRDEYSKMEIMAEPQQLDIEDLIDRCGDNADGDDKNNT